MRIFSAILFGLIGWTSATAQVQVQQLRMWPAPDHTRVVFDVSRALEYKLFVLADPHRVVVDLHNAVMADPPASPAPGDRLLQGVRTASRGGKDLRVVLDLKRPAKPNSFLLRPNDRYGHRLVVDLYQQASPPEKATAETAKKSPRKALPRKEKYRDVVVAIDPGHGGEDPGASGSGGTKEKHVVLAVAKKLHAILKRERGIKPVLVRSGDYYVGLRKRMEIARKHRADLFISLHADSFRDPRVHGSAVYILSRNGASSEAARWLAAQENAADLAGGVTLDDKDELLASVLLDLSQTATLSASADVGGKILKQLGKVGKTHKKRVERAGFAVLKSPDIPSILVETGFITSRKDEKRLTNPKIQRKVAKAIASGVRKHFERNAPPGTLLSARQHVIERGETLSGIAQRYRVSLNKLQAANQLSSNTIQAGDILTIPSL